ncbi:HypC/HybG/HupF family hydrogenase formation chaperone [Mycobacterium xenopi]|uniref:Hydrogenase assembly protein HypC n=2 Tax=Mycobacterium xenopi TaxID=1789 RepID=A0AAD1GX12_MYCXE|nr:HypC/HybG/HupF family hydrogenase formation chaperone [Mycobacterium xenopi]EUA23040.1 hydrogenase assembly chaperone HypC/HupF [Mycobacterium xenopi 4042]EUA52047.1 hydrogenase assembly chaperone HypC/HupF [Mycobacterium xenopi 3993]MDA3641620.1 HypC/HybG/HupF family hydrogenase formation chaperone [Mycobacterium xenopi]MDA3659378.1 HypC/HybG/HupF family hydrogenase formation chaperone [Mycobacterium xenopi]MDA3663870.1 HypC/HybG/HupF family hydrogenase formation chaperone [Mycobacterium x
MCLGIPGRITEVWDGADGGRFARVRFPGEIKTACLAYRPDLEVGDYTIVHAGFALTRIDETAALQTLVTMREYGVFDAGQAIL